ncbi:MAG: hypothetical protein M1818_003049 [Claussenomyces sp. TS43310]|nr:MAG: hypothetical protein M1818_003049 [Claussenomyces sp. TS43310]
MFTTVTRLPITHHIRSLPIWRSTIDSNPASRFLHATASTQLPRKRQFFSSNAALQADAAPETVKASTESLQVQKRKAIRSAAGSRSLRRVAAEAQRSRDAVTEQKDWRDDRTSKQITAICVAEEFDMVEVVRILRSHGFEIDPHETGFVDEQVVHTRGVNNGDLFVFPSGTLVAWSLPEDVAVDLATVTLLPAAINPHTKHVEMEDLEYKDDNTVDISIIKGDIITLGTKVEQESGGQSGKVDTTLAKIAFSSGLARSTKLSVLEAMLNKYFESTRSIPTLLSRGSRLPFGRRFILQKTGELLEIRAQLNSYSELTDSLPDLFWDSRHDLGLEGYYDQVGKALDVGIRIKTLNQKMDYAQEEASILRETLSEKHSTHLEWIIILLIAVEVAFELRRWAKEIREEKASE